MRRGTLRCLAMSSLAAAAFSASLHASGQDADAPALSERAFVVYTLAIDGAALAADGRATSPQAAIDRTIEALSVRLDDLEIDGAYLLRRGGEHVEIGAPVAASLDIEALRRPATLGFHVVLEPGETASEPTRRLPYSVAYGAEARAADEIVIASPALPGAVLIEAQQTFGSVGDVGVLLVFDADGARRFERLSIELQGRRFAIVLNDEIVSAPVVRTPISDGRALISGALTAAQAQRLAAELSASVLFGEVEIVERRVVDPIKEP